MGREILRDRTGRQGGRARLIKPFTTAKTVYVHHNTQSLFDNYIRVMGEWRVMFERRYVPDEADSQKDNHGRKRRTRRTLGETTELSGR